MALAEVKSLAEALDVPLTDAAELLADDRDGYVPPAALALRLRRLRTQPRARS
jgi:hypothetical protein